MRVARWTLRSAVSKLDRPSAERVGQPFETRMSLQATVQRLRNRADDTKLSQTDRDSFIAAWRRDVADVFERLRSALLQVIDADVVSFKVAPVMIGEEELGEYQIDAMTMTIVDQMIVVEPVARRTVGGTGRLDLYRSDRPSEGDRIFIVRGTNEVSHAPDEWLIETKRPSPAAEAATPSVVRGYRTYVAMTTNTIQGAVDALLNLH